MLPTVAASSSGAAGSDDVRASGGNFEFVVAAAQTFDWMTRTDFVAAAAQIMNDLAAVVIVVVASVVDAGR